MNSNAYLVEVATGRISNIIVVDEDTDLSIPGHRIIPVGDEQQFEIGDTYSE